MSKTKVNPRILIAISALILSGGAARLRAQHEHHPKMEQMRSVEETLPQRAPQNDQKKDVKENQLPVSRENDETVNSPETVFLSLAEIERLALENNPTLKQAELLIRAAEGRKTQAGFLQNPIVGVSGEDVSFRNFTGGGKVSFFVEQKIPLGGKPAKSRRVREREVWLADTAKQRRRFAVLNSVRLLYLEVLGAQIVADLKKESAKLAAESVETEAELYNVGLADRPDHLKAEISEQRAEAEYVEAQNKYEEAWRRLAAVIGRPDLPSSRLSENPAEILGEINPDQLLANLLTESPEIKGAIAKVEKAKMALRRARAEKIPDLYLRAGVGYNNEIVESLSGKRRAGAEGFLEVGVTLPIFDRNQGGIKTAEAELAVAESDVDRLRLVLRTKFARVFSNYRSSLSRADRYRTLIVPKAKAAFEMYSVNFQNMTAAYTNVLTARAAYLEAQIQHSESLIAAGKSLVLLKGFLLSGGLDAPGETETNYEGEIAETTENPVNRDEENRK